MQKLLPKIVYLSGVLTFSLTAFSANLQNGSYTEYLGDEGLDYMLFEQYEQSRDSEFSFIEKIFTDAVQVLKRDYAEPGSTTLRDAHAKSHGCLRGTFAVNNSNLEENLKVGVFSENKTYNAWVRFSNNHSDATRHDNISDLRGMSIKLLGVPGKKILPDEQDAQTQDFLMFGSPVFFLKNNKDYKIFLDFINEGAWGALKSASTRLEAIPDLVTGFIAVNKRVANIKDITNPLDIPYFSATPYRLGDKNNPFRKAIKFGVDRIACENEKIINVTSDKNNPNQPNYLRKSMVHAMSLQDACFDFWVQFLDPQMSKGKNAVEDPRIEWLTPKVSVATLKLEKQIFDTAEQNRFCENLSFTPWHSLADHRPLGRTNRARGVLYNVISKHRHEKNQVERVEPNE